MAAARLFAKLTPREMADVLLTGRLPEAETIETGGQNDEEDQAR